MTEPRVSRVKKRMQMVRTPAMIICRREKGGREGVRMRFLAERSGGSGIAGTHLEPLQPFPTDGVLDIAGDSLRAKEENNKVRPEREEENASWKQRTGPMPIPINAKKENIDIASPRSFVRKRSAIVPPTRVEPEEEANPPMKRATMTVACSFERSVLEGSVEEKEGQGEGRKDARCSCPRRWG